MPKRPSRGVRQVAVELPPDLVDQFREHAQARRRTFKEELIRAMRRHMAYPEPAPEPDPPLGPLPVPAQAKGAKKGRAKK
ncbi:MAG: hypothetical protein U0797_12940 [Gemmataceae bacterium]